MYESNTKNASECARECLHTRSLKTSPVIFFSSKNHDPVRCRSRSFQKLESVLYRITVFTPKANQYRLCRITVCTSRVWGGNSQWRPGIHTSNR